MADPVEIWQPNEDNIRKAAAIIRDGGLVICPSDTNLAIVVDPWNERAVRRVFDVKRRAATSPLTLFVAEPDEWASYGEPDERGQAKAITAAFWPGPLNIVVRAGRAAPGPALMGGDTIAIGCLSNPTARALITAVGHPVAMTSANLSGQANGILVDLDIAHTQIGHEVDAILDGRAMATTMSSTIVSMVDGMRVLRQGDVKVHDLTVVADVCA